MESDVKIILEDCSLERLQSDLKVLETVREGIFQGKYKSEEKPGKQYGICYGIKKALESVENNYGKPVLFTYDLAVKYGNAIPGDGRYFWWLTDINIGDILAGKISAKETDGFIFDKQHRVEFLDWMIAQYKEQITESKRPKVQSTEFSLPRRLERALMEYGEEVVEKFKINLVNRHKEPKGLKEKLAALSKMGLLGQMVSTAFIWGDTPEGHLFWKKISQELGETDGAAGELFKYLPRLLRLWLEEEGEQIKFAYLHSLLQSGRNSKETLSTRPLEASIDAPFVWVTTPEGQEFWENANLAWITFLRDQEENVVYVPLSGMRQIYSVACYFWKERIKDMTTEGLSSPVDEVVKLYPIQIKQMYKAANSEQRKVLKAVLGEKYA